MLNDLDKEQFMLKLRFNGSNICVEKSRKAWMQIEKIASKIDTKTNSTLLVINKYFHDLKSQEQCKLETEKYISQHPTYISCQVI